MGALFLCGCFGGTSPLGPFGRALAAEPVPPVAVPVRPTVSLNTPNRTSPAARTQVADLSPPAPVPVLKAPLATSDSRIPLTPALSTPLAQRGTHPSTQASRPAIQPTGFVLSDRPSPTADPTLDLNNSGAGTTSPDGTASPLTSVTATSETTSTPMLAESVYTQTTPQDFRFKYDAPQFLPSVWSDMKAFFRFHDGPLLYNSLILGAGGGLAAYSNANWDDSVRQNTLDHSRRWGAANNVFDVIGHPATQFTATGILYGVSLINDDPRLHEFTKANLNALIFTTGSVVILKTSFDTTRPNGNSQGFPSGHTASSFAMAAVVDEYYGPWAGVGAYTVAGLVGWQRIDSRNHDLSDVLFGASLGYVIGHTVAKNHLRHHPLVPCGVFVDPEQNLTGVQWLWKY